MSEPHLQTKPCGTF